jgi:hypothetical protein
MTQSRDVNNTATLTRGRGEIRRGQEGR